MSNTSQAPDKFPQVESVYVNQVTDPPDGEVVPIRPVSDVPNLPAAPVVTNRPEIDPHETPVLEGTEARRYMIHSSMPTCLKSAFLEENSTVPPAPTNAGNQQAVPPIPPAGQAAPIAPAPEAPIPPAGQAQPIAPAPEAPIPPAGQPAPIAPAQEVPIPPAGQAQSIAPAQEVPNPPAGQAQPIAPAPEAPIPPGAPIPAAPAAPPRAGPPPVPQRDVDLFNLRSPMSPIKRFLDIVLGEGTQNPVLSTIRNALDQVMTAINFDRTTRKVANGDLLAIIMQSPILEHSPRRRKTTNIMARRDGPLKGDLIKWHRRDLRRIWTKLGNRMLTFIGHVAQMDDNLNLINLPNVYDFVAKKYIRTDEFFIQFLRVLDTTWHLRLDELPDPSLFDLMSIDISEYPDMQPLLRNIPRSDLQNDRPHKFDLRMEDRPAAVTIGERDSDNGRAYRTGAFSRGLSLYQGGVVEEIFRYARDSPGAMFELRSETGTGKTLLVPTRLCDLGKVLLVQMNELHVQRTAATLLEQGFKCEIRSHGYAKYGRLPVARRRQILNKFCPEKVSERLLRLDTYQPMRSDNGMQLFICTYETLRQLILNADYPDVLILDDVRSSCRHKDLSIFGLMHDPHVPEGMVVGALSAGIQDTGLLNFDRLVDKMMRNQRNWNLFAPPEGFRWRCEEFRKRYEEKQRKKREKRMRQKEKRKSDERKKLPGDESGDLFSDVTPAQSPSKSPEQPPYAKRQFGRQELTTTPVRRENAVRPAAYDQPLKDSRFDRYGERSPVHRAGPVRPVAFNEPLFYDDRRYDRYEDDMCRRYAERPVVLKHVSRYDDHHFERYGGYMMGYPGGQRYAEYPDVFDRRLDHGYRRVHSPVRRDAAISPVVAAKIDSFTDSKPSSPAKSNMKKKYQRPSRRKKISVSTQTAQLPDRLAYEVAFLNYKRLEVSPPVVQKKRRVRIVKKEKLKEKKTVAEKKNDESPGSQS